MSGVMFIHRLNGSLVLQNIMDVRAGGAIFIVMKEPSVFESIAVVGATGAVGHIILQLLQERDFPARRFKFLASGRSAGSKIKFRGGVHRRKARARCL